MLVKQIPEFAKSVNIWIGPGLSEEQRQKREAILIKEVPITKNTLRQIKQGSHNPGELLKRRLIEVMAKHPIDEPGADQPQPPEAA